MASVAPGVGIVGSTTVTHGTAVAVAALPPLLPLWPLPRWLPFTIATPVVVVGWLDCGLVGSDFPADPLLS